MDHVEIKEKKLNVSGSQLPRDLIVLRNKTKPINNARGLQFFTNDLGLSLCERDFHGQVCQITLPNYNL